jgi:hypothetical protein
VHLIGLVSATGARAAGSAASSGDQFAIWSDLDVIDQQTGRRQ